MSCFSKPCKGVTISPCGPRRNCNEKPGPALALLTPTQALHYGLSAQRIPAGREIIGTPERAVALQITDRVERGRISGSDQQAQTAGKNVFARQNVNPVEATWSGGSVDTRLVTVECDSRPRNSTQNWTQTVRQQVLKTFMETPKQNIAVFYKMAEILLQASDNAWQALR